MRKILFLILVLQLQVIKAQNIPLPAAQQYIPTAPESSSLGRYGSISNSASTGQMNYQVPLFNIGTNEKKIDINLNYNFGGLLLKDKPSISGLGWTLINTGVINREVRGIPDESTFGYYGLNSQRHRILNYKSTGIVNSFDFFEGFIKNKYDTAADVYTVSIYDINFSFKIDANNNAVFLSKHLNKVQIIKDQYRSNIIEKFIVVDHNGIEYSLSAKEKMIPLENEEFIDYHVDTSWKLTAIKDSNNEMVTFQYTDRIKEDYDFQAFGNQYYENYTPYGPGNYQEKFYQTKILNKILNRIIFKAGYIDLNYSDIGNNTLCNAVQLRNSLSQVVSSYEFVYSGVRNLLTEIKKNNQSFYSFEYYDAENIPNFLTYFGQKALNQDEWGYFNDGANQFALNLPFSNFLADLRPNFAKTRTGALKKINYPTKGFTEIDYELNEISVKVNSSNYYLDIPLHWRKFKLRLEGNNGNLSLPQHKETEMVWTFLYPTAAKLNHIISGQRFGSHIILSIDKLNQCDYSQYYPIGFAFPSSAVNVQYNYHNYAPSLRNAIIQQLGSENLILNPDAPFMCPRLLESYGPDDGGSNTVVGGADRIVFLPGTYKFKIESDLASQTQAFGEITLQLQENFNTAPPMYVNKKVGGLRVSKIVDYTSNSIVAQERHFDYNDTSMLSSGTLNTKPMHKVQSERIQNYDTAPLIQTFKAYNTDLYSGIRKSFGTPIFYSKITEKNIGIGKTHYTAREFSIPGNIKQSYRPVYPLGNDLSSDRLAKIQLYDENKNLLSKTENDLRFVYNLYTVEPIQNYPSQLVDVNPLHPWSVSIFEKAKVNVDAADGFTYTVENFDSPGYSLQINNFIKKFYDVIFYKEINFESRIEENLKTEYFQNNIITNSNKYVFSPRNQIIEVINDFNGKVIKTKYVYPHDLQNEPFMSDLTLVNRVNIPIITEQYKSGILTSKNKITFSRDATTSSLLLPKNIYSAKFPNNLPILPNNIGQLENKLSYNQYDNKGNILQYTPENGISVSIIYGYNQTLPIAKLENVDYASVLPYVANLETASNIPNNDAALMAALQNLRTAFPNAMITTYTHKPLVGVSTITDPKGDKITYSYDSFGRLQYVTDKNGNKLSENQYNYKP